MGNRVLRISLRPIFAELENYVISVDEAKGHITRRGMLRKINEIKRRIVKNFPVKEDSK